MVKTENQMKYGDYSKWVENSISHLSLIHKQVYNFIIFQGYKLKQKEGLLIFENPMLLESNGN